jgi:Na+/pantothenate symporter
MLGLEMKEVDIFMHVFFSLSRWLYIQDDYNYVEDKLHMKSKVSIVLDGLMIIYAHLLFLQMWCAIVSYCLILIFNFGGDEFTTTWILSKGVYFSKRLDILLCLILISIITYGFYYIIFLQHDEKSVKGHMCKEEGRSCVHLNVGD